MSTNKSIEHLNPTQSKRRSTVQWYFFPLRRVFWGIALSRSAQNEYSSILSIARNQSQPNKCLRRYFRCCCWCLTQIYIHTSAYEFVSPVHRPTKMHIKRQTNIQINNTEKHNNSSCIRMQKQLERQILKQANKHTNNAQRNTYLQAKI